MNNDTENARKFQLKQLMRECVIVAVLGILLALMANQVSPRGLALTRNYFPDTPLATNGTAGVTGTNAVQSAVDKLAAQLQPMGIQLADSNMVVQLFQDPRYAQELIIFIDARDDKHYNEGHIPGAFQLDYYRKENYLPTVLPACLTAEQIVVYCTGGNCEDSVFAAMTLKDAGIPTNKIFVYAGGMSEWGANGLPVELGSRKSGNLRTNKTSASGGGNP